MSRQTELLAHAAKLTKIALEGVELATMLERIARYLRRTFAVELVEITLIDQTGQQQSICAQAGRSTLGLGPGDLFPTNLGLSGVAIAGKKMVYAPDVSKDKRYLRSSKTARSNLVIPIRRREGKNLQVLGCINLESYELDGFSPDTRTLLDALANQLAGAIYLAQINERLQQASATVAEHAKTLEQVNRKLLAANKRLLKLSIQDSLTGLANHAEFHRQFKAELARAARNNRAVSLILLDADYFKLYNDKHGHSAGDRALLQIARVLKQYTRRAGELAGRLGGEEFAILLPELAPAAVAVYAENLRAQIAGLDDCTTVSVGTYVGVATPGEQAQAWFENADLALYQAKKGGRNRVVNW